VESNAWNRIRYTLIAPLYDRVARFDSARRRSVGLLALHAGERVLIPGCGTGADLPFLPPEVEVVAGDITPAMVRRTRDRAERLGRAADVRLMDAAALDLPDATFDAVILHLILAVIPDPVGCIREAERVLRPGGRIAVFDKWVRDGARPSPLRRLANVFARVVATELTRSLGPLVAETGIALEHREPAGPFGLFEIALLRKPGKAGVR
jgi:ubiquinone/menaquinone biosynthesis C-methylase UbiE